MRDETAKPVSRDQVLRREPGQGNINYLCSADHKHDWQTYPVDPYSALFYDHTYIFIRARLEFHLYEQPDSSGASKSVSFFLLNKNILGALCSREVIFPEFIFSHKIKTDYSQNSRSLGAHYSLGMPPLLGWRPSSALAMVLVLALP